MTVGSNGIVVGGKGKRQKEMKCIGLSKNCLLLKNDKVSHHQQHQQNDVDTSASFLLLPALLPTVA